MCCKLLGPTVDIHAGGVDLVFPHHQNEIAQSEAYTGKHRYLLAEHCSMSLDTDNTIALVTGKPLSRHWMHNGFVTINNEKMSKSLKNFKTLR